MIDVTKRGVTGNGTTDDTDALQAVVNEGIATAHPCYLPSGRYKITRPIIMHGASGLFGDGVLTCIYTEKNIPRTGPQLRVFPVT